MLLGDQHDGESECEALVLCRQHERNRKAFYLLNAERARATPTNEHDEQCARRSPEAMGFLQGTCGITLLSRRNDTRIAVVPDELFSAVLLSPERS